MILVARTWKGGSTYDVTVQPAQLIERLPLPGEEMELGDMGRVQVTSASDDSDEGWVLPAGRRWRLRVQTRDIGPEFADL